MTVDKHELLFRILNRGVFSLWVNCPHDLAVKNTGVERILHALLFRRNKKTFSDMFFPSSRSLVYILNESFFNYLTRINF